jgi:hypothetical protein
MLAGREMAARFAERVLMTVPTAALVDSSESGHRCPYVSNVVLAVAWRNRVWMIFTSSPEGIRSDA